MKAVDQIQEAHDRDLLERPDTADRRDRHMGCDQVTVSLKGQCCRLYGGTVFIITFFDLSYGSGPFLIGVTAVTGGCLLIDLLANHIPYPCIAPPSFFFLISTSSSLSIKSISL